MQKKRVNKMLTPAGENLPDIPWNVYPRPKMRRNSFLTLNGKWKFGVKDKGGENVFDSEILVPFPPESILSGIDKVFPEDKTRVYCRDFFIPKGFNKGRIILHFGAVDQIARVFVNGVLVVEHTGGYTPFSADVTDYIRDENQIVVEVDDYLSNFILPYGKQTAKPHGMWYTPVSGIWQTVWLESVPIEYIKSVKTDCNGEKIKIIVDGVKNAKLSLNTPNGKIVKNTENGIFEFTIDEPVFWSPENPYLYDFTVTTQCDHVHSYFAIRMLEVKTVNGIKRLCLNGKPYFFHGLLDQGYFSDGLFLPATPETYGEEILKVKALGFNTLRKHIKAEPQIFYYECDRKGIIVWQDMINNGSYNFFRDTALPTLGFTKKKDKRIHKNKAQRDAFLSTMKETVELLKEHPSICYWTIFNEGWGQFESEKAYEALKALDETRFIDTTSGWFKCGSSDVESKHIYFKKIKIKPTDKPVVVSEFGGSAYVDYEHVYNPEKAHGYGQSRTRERFVESTRKLYKEQIIPAIEKGLCGAIYTQVSDIEDETNGLFTYDRRVDKISPEEFKDISDAIKTQIEKV